MSALEIREQAAQAIHSDKYDFIAINFANADMVGHTGNMEATIKAVEILDLCLGNISKAVIDKGGVMIITADHGNAERMIDPNTGEINKEHTSLPVPFIIIGSDYQRSESLPDPPDLSQMLSGGLLSDVAPTLMKILNLPVPEAMSGRSLV
jgi:2,3-bisphosphoglycerate-independent phosphoglycerate mutase